MSIPDSLNANCVTVSKLPSLAFTKTQLLPGIIRGRRSEMILAFDASRVLLNYFVSSIKDRRVVSGIDRADDDVS